MQINYIGYSRTKNTNYSEHESIEISSFVAPEDDPQEILLYLQNWVNERLQVKEVLAKLDSRKDQLQGEIYDLEKNVVEARDKWQKVKVFLEKLGVERVDDIPF